MGSMTPLERLPRSLTADTIETVREKLREHLENAARPWPGGLTREGFRHMGEQLPEANQVPLLRSSKMYSYGLSVGGGQLRGSFGF